MAGHSPRRPSTYTVPCRCGARHIVAVSTFGRIQTCSKCKSGYMVVWRKDAKTGAQVPMVVSSRPRAVRAPKPAAPQGPLIDLSCNCGYRRKATSDELRKGCTCPGCGNPMYVDRPARSTKTSEIPVIPFSQKSRYALPVKALPPAITRPATPPLGVPYKPTPRPFAAPTSGASATPSPFKSPSTGASATPSAFRAPVVGETRSTLSGKMFLTCPMCGDRQLVSPAAAERQVKCLRCESPMIVQGAPPPSPAPTPPPVVETLEPLVDAEPERPRRDPRPAPAFVTGPSLDCPCGESIDVRGASPGSVFSCKHCFREVTMEKGRHPQTLQTLLKPIFSEEPAEPPLDVSLEPGAIEVICECGEGIVVSLRDVGHPVQCPACSMLLEVEKAPNGLKVTAIGRIDEQSWSMNDFT
jgi:hypothetical protein